MKLITYWWGIELIADNKKDEDLLKNLHDCIGDKADEYYEDGSIEVDTESAKEGTYNYSGFTLRISR